MNPSERILVVDDNETNLEIVEEILGGDYPLLLAHNGDEALDLAAKQPPALVLLDIMMPGIDGVEVCRRMRAIPSLRHTKIIMVSAKSRVTDRLQSYEAGADDYLPRPFDIDELVAKVRVFLRLRSAEEVEELKSTVLTLLGHELNTPLTGLLLPTEMLLSEDEMSTQERRDFAEMIQLSAERLQRIIERTLRLNQLRASKEADHFSTLPLVEVAAEAITKVGEFCEERGVAIDTGPQVGVSVSGDLSELVEVVEELLRNAIRFSEPESTVRVSIEERHDLAVLSVVDRGAGIDTEFVPRMFEEFQVGDVLHHSQGSGLGLAIAKLIVGRHTGEIQVDSKPGEGTTVSLLFPVHKEAALA
ncbi:MAG: hybrid sensor histidine kinase/response regulator [Planctomycetota bacterium]